MDVFSRVTTILIFMLLCYALVTRGIEFISIASQKIRKLQTPSGRENRINFIEIFWSASITTLKLMLFLHLVLSQISPWYQSLPKA